MNNSSGSTLGVITLCTLCTEGLCVWLCHKTSLVWCLPELPFILRPSSHYFACVTMRPEVNVKACCNARIEKKFLCLHCNTRPNYFICTSGHNAMQTKYCEPGHRHHECDGQLLLPFPCSYLCALLWLWDLGVRCLACCKVRLFSLATPYYHA